MAHILFQFWIFLPRTLFSSPSLVLPFSFIFLNKWSPSWFNISLLSFQVGVFLDDPRYQKEERIAIKTSNDIRRPAKLFCILSGQNFAKIQTLVKQRCGNEGLIHIFSIRGNNSSTIKVRDFAYCSNTNVLVEIINRLNSILFIKIVFSFNTLHVLSCRRCVLQYGELWTNV